MLLWYAYGSIKCWYSLARHAHHSGQKDIKSGAGLPERGFLTLLLFLWKQRTAGKRGFPRRFRIGGKNVMNETLRAEGAIRENVREEEKCPQDICIEVRDGAGKSRPVKRIPFTWPFPGLGLTMSYGWMIPWRRLWCTSPKGSGSMRFLLRRKRRLIIPGHLPEASRIFHRKEEDYLAKAGESDSGRGSLPLSRIDPDRGVRDGAWTGAANMGKHRLVFLLVLCYPDIKFHKQWLAAGWEKRQRWGSYR